jgi:hypothetical protein
MTCGIHPKEIFLQEICRRKRANVGEINLLWQSCTCRPQLFHSFFSCQAGPTDVCSPYDRAMRTGVMLVVLAVLASCQIPSYGVVLNSSGEDIELSYRFNRLPRPPHSPVCARQPGIPLISDRRFKKPGKVPARFEGWSQSTSHQGDDSGCGIRNVRLQPGQAAMVEFNPACDDFEQLLTRNGADIRQYTPPYARLAAAAGRGFFTLENWEVTSRFKRMNSHLCVLEITRADLGA